MSIARDKKFQSFRVEPIILRAPVACSSDTSTVRWLAFGDWEFFLPHTRKAYKYYIFMTYNTYVYSSRNKVKELQGVHLGILLRSRLSITSNRCFLMRLCRVEFALHLTASQRIEQFSAWGKYCAKCISVWIPATLKNFWSRNLPEITALNSIKKATEKFQKFNFHLNGQNFRT